MEDKDDLAKVLAMAMNEVSEPLNDRLDEADARFTVHRYLLEMLYANAFIGDQAGFDAMMEDMLTALRSKSGLPEPMKADDVIERQARAATHLERFRQSVARRIETDQGL
jgi:hypothetical protein